MLWLKRVTLRLLPIFTDPTSKPSRIPQRIEEVTKYQTNSNLYIDRMLNAIDQVKAMTDDVDPDEIAIIGYCFGGSGVNLISMSTKANDAKVAVPFHGNFQQMPPVQGDVTPYLLV